MRIFKEMAGVTSEGPCWVCIHDEYIYVHDTLLGLLWMILTEFKHDRHIGK